MGSNDLVWHYLHDGRPLHDTHPLNDTHPLHDRHPENGRQENGRPTLAANQRSNDRYRTDDSVSADSVSGGSVWARSENNGPESQKRSSRRAWQRLNSEVRPA